MFRIVVVTAMLLGVSTFSIGQVTRDSKTPMIFGKTENRNVTSIAKNQIYPLQLEVLRDPCATKLCYSI